MRILIAFAAASALLLPRPAPADDRPNIVLIYADDLGYGDVSAYGATAVKTPNIDRLAREGLRFTDSHSAAATCTRPWAKRTRHGRGTKELWPPTWSRPSAATSGTCTT